MGLRYNPFTGSFDLTRSPGSYLDGEVATYADLPLDTAAAPLNSAWLVRAGSGLWLLTRKPAGIYIRTATGGTDRDADYTYAGTFPDVFSDANFTLYDDADSTKNAKFQLSGITTGTTRTLTVPDKSGTIATTDASDLTSGTLADARLSANVALLDTANTFTQNQTLNGTNNVAPNQTAASGSSVMTRDLVDLRFVTPRDRFDVTHFFGVQGAGGSVTAGTSPVAGVGVAGTGGSYASWFLYTSSRIGSNSAGAGLRLGSNAPTGAAVFANSSAGAYILRTRIGKAYNQGAGAMAFLLGGNTSSSMWHANSLGLYYVRQPTATWTATTAYSQHDRINVGGVVWAVSTAGTTGATEPAWTNTINNTVSDGTVVWRNCGPHTSDEWAFGFGDTDSSAISLTSTGKAGWSSGQRADVILTLRYGGQTAAPYLFYASVENAAGASAELSVSTNTNLGVSPQFWSRWDDNTFAGENAMSIRYFTMQSTLPALL